MPAAAGFSQERLCVAWQVWWDRGSEGKLLGHLLDAAGEGAAGAAGGVDAGGRAGARERRAGRGSDWGSLRCRDRGVSCKTCASSLDRCLVSVT